MDTNQEFWGTETVVEQKQTTGSKCEKCGGKGYYMVAQIYGRDPVTNEYGVIEAHWVPPDMPDFVATQTWPGSSLAICPVCDCQKAILARQRLERVLGQPGISDDCLRFSLDDFNDLKYARQALTFARQMVNGLPIDADEEKPGLLLVGPTGTGKTTLASVVFRLRVEQGQAGVWQDFNLLVKKIRATYRREYHGPDVDEIVDVVAKSEFLMLDDLGSITRAARENELYAEDAVEAVRTIANHRLTKRLPTIITTNLDKEQLYAQFGDRVVSRLRGLCHAATMIGGDFRAPGDRS